MITFLEYFLNENKFLSEGKHWPEDYVKTAKNIIKQSQLGQQSWYTDNFISKDLKTFVQEFTPLSHKNSNLGYFSPLIKWFVEYSGVDKNKYKEFIERKLDGIIGTLQTISNDPSYDKLKDEIKTKWTLKQFEDLQKKINAEQKSSSEQKLKNINTRNDYELILINSYEELHKKFGGNNTGYKGKSEWCHTNGKSTYESWTKNGTQMFFVLAKKAWKKIKPPTLAKNAYDEYGTSLIAILVDVQSSELLNETLRWNHIIEPSKTNSGASVDKAFKNNWGELSQCVGMNVKAEVQKRISKLQNKFKELENSANTEVENILKTINTITGDSIPYKIRRYTTHINIPDNVTDIGVHAFSGCGELTSVTIPDSVTSIGTNAFYGCRRLTHITIPNSVTHIGRGAFESCNKLTSVTIGNSVTSIGDYTFCECSALTSVMIPNSVTSIGEGAFQDCSNLKSIKIPDSVTSIGHYAFDSCSELTSIVLGNRIQTISNSFCDHCRHLTSIQIPNSVKQIGIDAFSNCSKLKSVIIGNAVTSIDDYAFYGCESLTSVMIPDSVTHIGEAAFLGCDNLKNVTIGNGIKHIDDFVFSECLNLKTLIFKGKTLDKVKKMENYPWDIPFDGDVESIIKVEN